MKTYFAITLLLVLTTAVDSFIVVLPHQQACVSSLGPCALVPEQAKELEAYFECDCELRKQHDEHGKHHQGHQDATAAAASAVHGRGPVAWCRRVWSGASKNQGRQPSVTSLAYKNLEP